MITLLFYIFLNKLLIVVWGENVSVKNLYSKMFWAIFSWRELRAISEVSISEGKLQMYV